MKSVNVVVDVHQNPQTGELVIVKQKLHFNGDAAFEGEPVESRIPLRNGSAVGHEFDHLAFQPSAWFRFDTLPFDDQLAVSKVVTPLQSVSVDKWQSLGFEPVEGTKNFMIDATKDLIVLVTPNERKGVEIVDVVYRETLEQFDIPDEDTQP